MTTSDRRAAERRGSTPSSAVGLGAVLAEERRGRNDRRQQPRRRTDLSSIAQLARSINASQTRLDVVVDGIDGMRLVAVFACGCNASEPIGNGNASVRTEPCPAHAVPSVAVDHRCPR